jgi:hypothetical protein
MKFVTTQPPSRAHIREGVADQRDALCVSLKVCSIQAKQELRWIVALVQERMAGWSVAV